MSSTGQSNLVLTDQCDIATRTSIYTRHRTGALVRVHHGAYFLADVWVQLDDIDRHRVRVQAIGRRLSDERVLSHLSAAALWQLPIIGTAPHLPQVVDARAAGGRSTRSLVRRETVVPPDRVEIAGVPRTRVTRSDLRAVGCTVARWPWATAMAPSALRQHLLRAGVR